MNIKENLKQIEAVIRSAYPCGSMGALESLAAIRESIAAQDDLVREHYRAYEAQIAALEKENRLLNTSVSNIAAELLRTTAERDEAECVGRVMTEETRVLRKRIAALEAAAKERDVRVERLEGALRNVRPGCRGSECWCPYGWDMSGGHSSACRNARAALSPSLPAKEPV